MRGLRGSTSMRPTKLAIADALRTDPAVGELVPAAQIFSVERATADRGVPAAQIFSVERATVPTLPSIEVFGVTSERVGDGPLAERGGAVLYVRR